MIKATKNSPCLIFSDLNHEVAPVMLKSRGLCTAGHRLSLCSAVWICCCVELTLKL